MQERNRRASRFPIGAASAAAFAVTAMVSSVLAATPVSVYVEPVDGEYKVKALFSVDDKVQLLGGGPGQQYRMETSGIIDASALFGADTWLSDVQAHPPTTAPGGSNVTVEDGQLFLMTPSN